MGYSSLYEKHGLATLIVQMLRNSVQKYLPVDPLPAYWIFFLGEPSLLEAQMLENAASEEEKSRSSPIVLVISARRVSNSLGEKK